MKSIIKILLREGLFDSISDEDFKKAYINKINTTRNNLLVKASEYPNYVFILGNNIKYNPCGNPNKCETNTYTFIKERINEGHTNFFPVGGYLFEGPNLYPIEHWWVYDSTTKEFIEITPIQGEKPRCYAGIINTEINDEIANTNNVFDVDFFKGGSVYYKYFK